MSEIELKAMAWDALMRFLEKNDVRLSETQTEKVVGGKRHRERLIEQGKLSDIRKKDTARNTPWQYAANEVLKHIHI